MSATYKKSGVDVGRASRLVRKISPMIQSTQKGRSKKNLLEGFGALYPARFSGYKEPLLVSSTDGVGTKLLLAQQLNYHQGVGIDLVAMNVNDILCVGAQPLFFMDYIACGKLIDSTYLKVMKGIVKGCQLAGASLIGGETAEMPGMYQPGEYDLAGFTVGVVEQKKMVTGKEIQVGDKIIGLASSGPHSNGYSLIRNVMTQRDIKQFSKELLKPTAIYVEPVLGLLKRYKVKGMAHITGGSFQEKLGKLFPKGLGASINQKSWRPPKIFQEIKARGVSEKEMYQTFNMGIGFTLIIPAKIEKQLSQYLKKAKIRSWTIGEVIKSHRKVEIC